MRFEASFASESLSLGAVNHCFPSGASFPCLEKWCKVESPIVVPSLKPTTKANSILTALPRCLKLHARSRFFKLVFMNGT